MDTETIKCVHRRRENLARDGSKLSGGLQPGISCETSQHECIQGINANNDVKGGTPSRVIFTPGANISISATAESA
jgi:hypothetical protein